mmetsp:Transcript_21640/g.56467  ORF Transcript_21640/g.56467 Transcript_21640/m.56467 type:complete len:450 (+) Transcript_21640:88-1437(+)
MPCLTLRIRVATFVFLLAASGLADQPRLQGGSCPEASGGMLDDVSLLQSHQFVHREVEAKTGDITVVTASKTAQLSMGGQATASARPALAQAHWPDGGPDWIRDRLPATRDKTVAAVVVGVLTLAVLVMLCFRIPLPAVHRRRREAVELPGVGGAAAPEGSARHQQQQQLKMLEEVARWSWEDAKWQGCREGAAAARSQAHCAPSPLLGLPAPVPRLRSVGASYVVPLGCIRSARGTTLSFDIPSLPAAWPLRAVLTRASPQSGWTKIDLTVDVAAAARVPPLLSCTVCAPLGEVHQRCSETTGGTGGTVPDGQSGDGVAPRSQWLAIRSSGGAILASVMPREKDPTGYVLQRQGASLVPWDVRFDGTKPSVVVSQLGWDIGLASSLGQCKGQPPREGSDASDDEDDVQHHLQFDTWPETQTPESLLLLMCFLAMVSLQPETPPQKQQE